MLLSVATSAAFFSEMQTEYSIDIPQDTEMDILVVGGGGAGGGNGQGGGGGAGAVIYYTGLQLNGTFTIKVAQGGQSSTQESGGANVKGSDSAFYETQDNTKKKFLATGGGGGGTWDDPTHAPASGGSGGGGSGGGTGATIVDTNVVNSETITLSSDNYVNTGFIGDRGVSSVGDTGCFGNKGGTDIFDGGDWGAGGGGAGERGHNTIKNSVGGNADKAGDGGDGKQFNINGTVAFYGGGGGGGLRPANEGTPTLMSKFNTGTTPGSGGQGGGGNGGFGGNGVDGTPGTGGGGGGVGKYESSSGQGGHGGSGIVIVRLRHATV